MGDDRISKQPGSGSVDHIEPPVNERTRSERSESSHGVALTHQTLAALIHCCVASDPEASPVGFQRACDLGLIQATANPSPTPLGYGVLRALRGDL